MGWGGVGTWYARGGRRRRGGTACDVGKEEACRRSQGTAATPIGKGQGEARQDPHDAGPCGRGWGVVDLHHFQTFKTRAVATSRASLTNSCRQLVPHLNGLPVTSINFRLVGVLYVAHLNEKMSGFGCHRLEPASSLQHEAAPLSVSGRRTVLTVAKPAGHAVAVRAWI